MTQTKHKGFTIIEVVLVLAITGLIFLMVFIAWPALQRSQRDAQRREDITKFVSQVSSYATNNKGSIPGADATSMNNFLNAYLKRSDGEFKDPQTGNDYVVKTGISQTAGTDQIVYATSAKCEGENIIANSNAPRSFAVKIRLEGSGFFCKDNQS